MELAVDKSRVYICDTGLAGLEVLDLEKGSFEYFIPCGKGAAETARELLCG